MIRVGTSALGYNEQRNFAGLPFDDVSFKEVYDLNKVSSFIRYKLTGRINYRKLNRFNDWGLSSVDIYHFFNAISPVRKPWVVTFETSLPRLDPHFQEGYEWLAGPYCKRLLAMTARAYKLQLGNLESWPQYREAIHRKMEILVPAQKLLVENLPVHSNTVTFTFAGGAFYRKGGWEMLHAFKELYEEGSRFRLIVVSDLSRDGFMEEHVSKTLIDETRMLLQSSWVTHYSRLPNYKVLELFKQSDVGILPSYSETFGYSLLEAMACGCAVISTNISPFDEFVNEEYGWLLNVPSKVVADVRGVDLSDSTFFSAQLVKEIKSVARKVIGDPDMLLTKRYAAISKIKTDHQPLRRSERINQIYKEALS